MAFLTERLLGRCSDYVEEAKLKYPETDFPARYAFHKQKVSYFAIYFKWWGTDRWSNDSDSVNRVPVDRLKMGMWLFPEDLEYSNRDERKDMMDYSWSDWSHTVHVSKQLLFAKKAGNCSFCDKPYEQNDIVSLGHRFLDECGDGFDSPLVSEKTDIIHVACPFKHPLPTEKGDLKYATKEQIDKKLSELTREQRKEFVLDMEVFNVSGIEGWEGLAKETKKRNLILSGKEPIEANMTLGKQALSGWRVLVTGGVGANFKSFLKMNGALEQSNPTSQTTHCILGCKTEHNGVIVGEGSAKHQAALDRKIPIIFPDDVWKTIYDFLDNKKAGKNDDNNNNEKVEEEEKKVAKQGAKNAKSKKAQKEETEESEEDKENTPANISAKKHNIKQNNKRKKEKEEDESAIPDNLDSLSRANLQQLCKQHQIPANIKSTDMIARLKKLRL